MIDVLAESQKKLLLTPQSIAPIKFKFGQYIAAMVDSNMFDLSSVAAEDLRPVGHDRQTFGEMLAVATHDLSTDFGNNEKHSIKTTSQQDNHLQESILTRDNQFTAPLDDQQANDSHGHISHQDMTQSASSQGQDWYTPAGPMSTSMTGEWLSTDGSANANMSSFQQQQQIDINLNYMYNNPSLLFQGSSSTDCGFMNDATPSNNEPIWQRRMHARNQSQQYDHALLSILAESQRSMNIPAPPAYSDRNENIQHTGKLMKRLSDGYSAYAHESSTSLSNVMSPVQMQWNHATSYYPGNSLDQFHGNYNLQRNSSASNSASSGNTQNTDNSFLNQNISSIPTSLSASPVEPNSAKVGVTSQWDIPMFDQSEESEAENLKKSSKRGSNGEKGSKVRKRDGKMQQNKIHRQSKGALSPRSVPVSLKSSNDEGIQESKSKKKSPESGSMNKGVISKVVVSKGSGVDGQVIETETAEGGETRHLCPQPGCDKHFSTSGHARRHSRIHASLRPFECPHEGCGATFTRRDNCTQHQRARHRCQLVAKRISDEISQSQSA